MDSNNMSNDVSTIEPSQIPVEKTFTQDEVNKIVGARAHSAAQAAAEKARREALQEIERSNYSQPNINSSSEKEAIKKEVLQEIQAHQQQQAEEYARKNLELKASQKTTEYFSKLQDTQFTQEHPDATDTFSKFNHAAYSNLASLTLTETNTADLMYHFAKNPILASQYELAARNDPQGTLDAIKQLSKDIQQNKQAKQSVRKAHEPLSRVAPSNIGADNEPRDLRYWKNSKLCKW